MADISHSFGSDIVLGATGDLLLASGSDLITQRILRRLLTNAGGYIWQLAYGAGLPQMVGQPENPTSTEAIVRSQIFAETDIAQSPPPTITTKAQPDGTVTLTVTYTEAATGITQTILDFPVSQ